MDASKTANIGTGTLHRAANDNAAAARRHHFGMAPAAVLGTPWPGATRHEQDRLRTAPRAAGLTFRAYTDLDDVAETWETLQRDALAFPFQTYVWLTGWHRDVGRRRGIEPFVVVGRDRSGTDRIIFPLGIERGWLTTRLVWLGHPTCDYNAPLVCPVTLADLSVKDADAMLRAILSLAPGIDYAYLARQPARIGTADNPFHYVSAHPFSAGAHAASLDGTWDGFYRNRRSGRARNKNARMEKRLAALGEIHFECVEDPLERSKTAAWVLDLKHRQLEQTGARSPFGADDIRSFFDRMTSNDELKLFRLTLDGEPLAAVLGLVRNGCFYYLVPVYEFGARARCSPGNALLHRVIEWSFDQGLSRFDFTIGDEAYKRDWSDIDVPMSFTCLSASPRGRLAAAAVRHAMAVKKWLKRHPLALRAASYAVRMAPSWR